MPTVQRVRSLELALAKLIDASRQLGKITNWTSPEFDQAVQVLTLTSDAAEKILHRVR